jgi:hypothetical protein
MATAMATTKTEKTTMTTTATATVTAAMMMTTTTAAAPPFVAPAVGWLMHCCPPPAIIVARRTMSCNRQCSRRRRLSPPLPLQLLVGTYIVVRRPISSSPANVRYSIPSSPRCPQTLSLPAAARLFHSRRWLVVASLFATHFHCPTPSLPCCPQTLLLPVPIFIVLPLHRHAAPRRTRRQSPPTCAIPVDGWLLRRCLPPIFIVLPLLL